MRLASAWGKLARKGFEQRALARAVGADQRQDLALPQADPDIPEQRFSLIAHGKILRLQDIHFSHVPAPFAA